MVLRPKLQRRLDDDAQPPPPRSPSSAARDACELHLDQVDDGGALTSASNSPPPGRAAAAIVQFELRAGPRCRAVKFDPGAAVR